MSSNFIKTLILFGTIASMANLAHAQWTPEVKVKSVVVVFSGGINVAVEPSLSGCVSQSGYGVKYASIYPSHPGLKAMHANLLSAMISGTSIRLYLLNSECAVGEIVLGDTMW